MVDDVEAKTPTNDELKTNQSIKVLLPPLKRNQCPQKTQGPYCPSRYERVKIIKI